ncbi:hypothetical protein HPB50_001483 [Hyalomma asiaticum]|uniref:Uncharacterized protein n=1 Tax=Hyalomma asiaticum TaxID=266040 RepID=A0ACB7RXD5_HYAAI|nr:hypothetical protein HPB50_001483 [Hyalomma asiaticum]
MPEYRSNTSSEPLENADNGTAPRRMMDRTCAGSVYHASATDIAGNMRPPSSGYVNVVHVKLHARRTSALQSSSPLPQAVPSRELYGRRTRGGSPYSQTLLGAAHGCNKALAFGERSSSREAPFNRRERAATSKANSLYTLTGS